MPPKKADKKSQILDKIKDGENPTKITHRDIEKFPGDKDLGVKWAQMRMIYVKTYPKNTAISFRSVVDELDSRKINRLIAERIPGKSGDTALHLAAKNDDCETIIYLSGKDCVSANIDKLKNDQGKTPLVIIFEKYNSLRVGRNGELAKTINPDLAAALRNVVAILIAAINEGDLRMAKKVYDLIDLDFSRTSHPLIKFVRDEFMSRSEFPVAKMVQDGHNPMVKFLMEKGLLITANPEVDFAKIARQAGHLEVEKTITGEEISREDRYLFISKDHKSEKKEAEHVTEHRAKRKRGDEEPEQEQEKQKEPEKKFKGAKPQVEKEEAAASKKPARRSLRKAKASRLSPIKEEQEQQR